MSQLLIGIGLGWIMGSAAFYGGFRFVYARLEALERRERAEAEHRLGGPLP